MLARSNYVADIDEDSCTACGICADERCPVNAIEETETAYQVLPDRCIGCGVCTLTCPVNCITINQRPESEMNIPPKSMLRWSVERLKNRRAD